jgi:hypothetical protein
MRPRLKSPLPRIGSIASRSTIESFIQLASVRATWGLDRNRSNRTRALCGATARWALCHHVSQKRDMPIAYEDQPCGASRGPFLRMLASVIGGPHSCSAITCQFRASREQQAPRSYRAERQHRQNDSLRRRARRGAHLSAGGRVVVSYGYATSLDEARAAFRAEYAGLCHRACHFQCRPVRLSGFGRSLQFGRTSAPIMPH